MKLESNKKSSSFEPISEDLHEAVCIGSIGIGKQTFVYNGETKILNKMLLLWEIPKERREWENKEGEKFEGPATISKEYTVSFNEKSNLVKDLKQWLGEKDFEGFDTDELVGQSCRLMIGHSKGKNQNADKTYANVTGISKYKGDPIEPEQELVCYNPENHTEESFSKLKEWIQKKVILADGTCPHVEGNKTGDISKSNQSEITEPKEEDIPF
jgi:hypothetical protein